MPRPLLITSAGGPATEQVIQSIRNHGAAFYDPHPIIGIDMDANMLNLSSSDLKFTVPRADDPMYVPSIRALARKFGVTMFYPQSDKEIFIAAQNRKVLPSMTIPSLDTIKICRDKALLYEFLLYARLPVPWFAILGDIELLAIRRDIKVGDWEFPLWLRSRTGAGGYMGYKCDSMEDIRHILDYYKDKKEIEWMVCQYLSGKDYSWTSIWKDGNLLTSVLKERIKWVYDRIGTTAVQRTVHDDRINEYCEAIVKGLEPKITGLMMIDLKAESPNVLSDAYITEINAGRTGTVCLFHSVASEILYKDWRVNFPYLLWLIHHKESLPSTFQKFNALPEDLYWVRHIDMGWMLAKKDGQGLLRMAQGKIR